MNNGRDCEHGQLARSCDRCADAAEIAELRASLAAERASRQEAQRRLEAMQEDAIRHQRDIAQAVAAERERMRSLISDDASAATYQSLGQYRTALLRALRA